MKLGMISLGCAKNQIDTELFLGLATKYNITITREINDADILVVNTCGFIEPAKKEAIDTILELSDYKKDGKIIVAMGCLVERYLDSLKTLLPEVDYFIPIRNYHQLDKLFQQFTKSDESFLFDYQNRVLSTLPHTAYLRIAEGCNNRCSYCAIPLIRGNFKSRKMDDILAEAKSLAKNGVKEITIIAQDTTRYGTDLGENAPKIEHLLHELSLIPSIEWIRILYLYPDEVTDGLINEIKNNEKVVKYFDLPLQHASNRMLNAMNRRGDKEFIRNLIDKVKTIPGVILRTTFIVGFPNETDDDFLELVDFVKDIRFDRVGVFKYSDEEDTKGYSMTPKVPKKIMNKRLNQLMEIQNMISYEKNQKQIGKTYRVLIDEYDYELGTYKARSYAFAPDDVDGYIYVKSDEALLIGEFYQVLIVKANSYDLFAIIK